MVRFCDNHAGQKKDTGGLEPWGNIKQSSYGACHEDGALQLSLKGLREEFASSHAGPHTPPSGIWDKIKKASSASFQDLVYIYIYIY